MNGFSLQSSSKDLWVYCRQKIRNSRNSTSEVIRTARIWESNQTHNLNKDGSRDERTNDNYQSAGYTSEWLCKECVAKTTVKHYISGNPSKNVGAWKVTLKSNGSGKRIAGDWESGDGTLVDKNEAHRKGDN